MALIHTKKDAEKYAKRLAEELGAGWEPNVFNNLGWHVSAKLNGGMAVVDMNPTSERTYGSFSCVINDGRFANTGDTNWTTSFSSDDPVEVFSHELKSMEEYIDKIISVHNSLSSKVKKTEKNRIRRP